MLRSAKAAVTAASGACSDYPTVGALEKKLGLGYDGSAPDDGKFNEVELELFPTSISC